MHNQTRALPHSGRRGMFQEILAVVLGLLIPIALILGGYYFFAAVPEEAPAPIVQPAQVPVPMSIANKPPIPDDIDRPPDFPDPRDQPARPGQTPDPVYPTRAVVKPYPGDVGDFFLQAPNEGRVKKGEEFTVDLIMNTGDSLIAATTMFVHFDPLVLEFQSIKGSLTKGSRSPLATNLKAPGVLIISDINAPQTPKPGVSPYNSEMRGTPIVYRILFTAVGNPGESSYIGGGSTVFHDEGTDLSMPAAPTRPPTQIGNQPFPRPASANVAEIVVQ